MGWIKRNLFFVIGGVIALALLGGSGFYIYQGWSSNSDAGDKLNEIYGTLKSLADQKPGPGSNNTEIAKEQDKQLRDWLASAANYFQPIPAIPADAVTSETFAAALRRTVAQLQKEAKNSSVTLPPQYDFSFAAQRPLMQFASGSLTPLSVQLGEIKTISEILFAARINSLDSIQRVRVSEDDTGGPQTDYTEGSSVTNQLAVITPYVINFRSFTPELAGVICGFANSSNSFIIKSITVEPAQESAGEAGQLGTDTGAVPGMPPREFGPGGYQAAMARRYGFFQTPAAAPPPPPVVNSRGGLQSVLKEQLLHISIEVELVKLLPKS